MKDDFLPIPDAPNYEINSELICRNTKTDYIMTPFQPKHYKNFVYRLDCLENRRRKQILRTAKTLRAQAVAAVTYSTFEPIPSLGSRYEVNQRGTIRNTNTKKILKRKKYNLVTVDNNVGVSITRNFNTYLWEVLGYYRKPKWQRVKCSAENDFGKHFFDSLTDCANFLAPKIYFTADSIRSHFLVRRRTEVHGWKITYYEEDPSVDNWNRQALGFEALRMQKLGKERGIES